MQEQRVKDMASYIVIQRLFEFLRKDSVIPVKHRKHLNKM